MKLKPHPRYRDFETWFSVHLHSAMSVSAVAYRVAGPRYTSPKDIISGTGAFIAGGRRNAPGVMKVVYLSKTPETALFEANANHRYFKLPLWKAMPKVIVAVSVDVHGILDLADTATNSTLPVLLADAMSEDWRAVVARNQEAAAQALGRAAWSAGLHGLTVPSAADPGGINLLLFAQSISPPEKLLVTNPYDLEKLGRPT